MLWSVETIKKLLYLMSDVKGRGFLGVYLPKKAKKDIINKIIPGDSGKTREK